MQKKKLESIYKDISKLTGYEKKILLSRLVSEMKINSAPGSINSIGDIKGVGKEIWQGIDAQDYVDNERSSWS